MVIHHMVEETLPRATQSEKATIPVISVVIAMTFLLSTGYHYMSGLKSITIQQVIVHGMSYSLMKFLNKSRITVRCIYPTPFLEGLICMGFTWGRLIHKQGFFSGGGGFEEGGTENNP